MEKTPPPPPPAPGKATKKTSEPPPPAAASGGRGKVDAPAGTGGGIAVEERKMERADTAGPKKVEKREPPPPPKPLAPPKLFASQPAKSDIKQLLAERSKAAASTEAIGTEQIAKTGSSDAGAIIKQISGATVSEGKFAVIRGLNDRYISTTLNGANLPSADPYRQSAPLDLFPAQVIDRVVVTKTFTPDQPGSSTGGGIDVITKSFPDKDFISVSLGAEYNTQATGNSKFLTYDGGGHDWAGMDDGTRALPDEVGSLAPIGQQFPDAPPSTGPSGTVSHTNKLHDAEVVNAVTRALGVTQFAPTRETAPPNHSFSAAAGGTTHLFGSPLGYFAGTSYKHDYSFYDDGIASRYQNGTELKSQYRDMRSLSVVNWSGMVNLAYKPFEDQELGFTFFYNQNGTDDARIQDQGFEIGQSATYRKFNLYYTERNLTTYQIKGDHRFPDAGGLQFNWGIALTQTTQDEPDARFFNDGNTGGGYDVIGSVPSPNKPTRYFRALDEDNQNYKLDWTLPFRNWKEQEGQFKWGLFDSSSGRDFTERQFYYLKGQGAGNNYNNDPNQFLTIDHLGLVSTRVTTNRQGRINYIYTWGDYVQLFDSLYSGDRNIKAAYLMLDLPVVEKLRLVGGARVESTDINVHSESYLDSSITGKKTNDTHLQQTDLLPSVGMIFSVTSNMNVRANYSQTIARPSFRELAAYYSYDPIISDYIEGNPLLSMTAIINYDLRWEWFPRPGELYSVSLFYKDITDAIERGNIKQEGDTITFFNNDAKLYGIEFELRKNLDFLGRNFTPFSFGGNLSLVKSEVNLSEEDLASKRRFFPDISDTRPLYDQSPYVLNLDFNYSNPGIGTSATLIFNVAGPRVSITKVNTEDVYEQPTPTLDFVLSQKVGRNMTVKFGAKNLLNPKIERTYGKNSDLLYSSYHRGRGFGLSFSYEF